jgi:hypothetical protein
MDTTQRLLPQIAALHQRDLRAQAEYSRLVARTRSRRDSVVRPSGSAPSRLRSVPIMLRYAINLLTSLATIA